MAQARAHVRKATAAYDLGHYTDAAKEYEAAYEQSLDSNMLFNVGQAWRMAGEHKKALTAYRSYLRNVPKGEQRALAEAKIKELEALPDAEPTTPPSSPPAQAAPATTTSVVAAPPAAAPAPAPVPVVAAKPLSATEGVSVESAPTERTEATARPFYARWPFWTAVGAVVGAGVVTAVILGSGKDGLAMPPTTYGVQRY